MKVEEKYKIYAHVFFGYVIIYSVLMLYAAILSDGSFFMAFIYIIFLLINKIRLYVRQIREEIFGFFFDSIIAPDKEELFFSVIKSLISIIIYIFFNAILIESLIRNLGETGPELLITILHAHYFIFPI